MITAVTLLHLQSSDDMKSKLKIYQFGLYSARTVNCIGQDIYDELGRYRLYDAVGANYQVLLNTKQICW